MKWIVSRSHQFTFPALPAGYREVRRSSVDDAEWLLLLNSSSEFENLDAQSLQNQVLNYLIPGTAIFVKCDGQLVGCAAICNDPAYPPYALLMYVVVLQRHRGVMIGRYLAMKTIASAAASGYRKILLHSDDHRIAAISLYLQMGFKPVIENAAARKRWAVVYDQVTGAGRNPPN